MVSAIARPSSSTRTCDAVTSRSPMNVGPAQGPTCSGRARTCSVGRLEGDALLGLKTSNTSSDMPVVVRELSVTEAADGALRLHSSESTELGAVLLAEHCECGTAA